MYVFCCFFFFSSRRRHTRYWRDWSSDVCSSDLVLVQINAMPYSEHDWHWRLRSAHSFGHAAAPETVRGTLALLDDEGIAGELALREARSGRVEVVQMWGRPESVRQEFNRRRAQ